MGVKFGKAFYYLGLRTAHVVDTYGAKDLHLVGLCPIGVSTELGDIERGYTVDLVMQKHC